MAGFAAEQLKGADFQKRWDWIEKRKAEGNELFAQKNYEDATDTYLGCLCGFDFKHTGSPVTA